ncbi:MAG: leucyl/phenylalanyl-tRNA--protein transferase [Fimbriimonadaceae bacterium]|nr:leucyl/phenylalanyl-tRNA--protein transferase [Fimbriimonadaceae bacterium]
MRGAELTPATVYRGYVHRAFPMAEDDGTIQWYRPNVRALFPIRGAHVSRSMRRVLQSGTFQVTFDRAFREVMHGCLRPEDNWIDEQIIRVFTEIHHEGWGHSCEVWRGDELVGGLYGIAIGAYFAAESMFHRETNASKVALISMVDRCRAEGFVLFDAQIMNPHLQRMGAFELRDRDFERALQAACDIETQWGRCPHHAPNH